MKFYLISLLIFNEIQRTPSTSLLSDQQDNQNQQTYIVKSFSISDIFNYVQNNQDNKIITQQQLDEENLNNEIIAQPQLQYCPCCGQPNIQTNCYFNLLYNQLQQQKQSFNFYETYFQQQEKIGSGSFGQVVKVIHHIKDIQLNTYAIKQIPIGENQKPYLLRALNEVQTLQKLQHENIVKYNYCFIENVKMAINVEQKQPCLNIVLEYCKGGSLENLLPSKLGRQLQNNEYNNIIIQCLNAVNHLHKQNILHRDIKLSNFLLTGLLPEVKAQEYVHQVYENVVAIRHQAQYFINKKNFPNNQKLQLQSDQLSYIRLVKPENIIVKLTDFGQQDESLDINNGTEIFMSKKVRQGQKHSQYSDLYSLGLSLMLLLTETQLQEDIDQFQYQVKKDFQQIRHLNKLTKHIVTKMTEDDTLLTAQDYIYELTNNEQNQIKKEILTQKIVQYNNLQNMLNNNIQQNKKEQIQNQNNKITSKQININQQFFIQLTIILQIITIILLIRNK